MKKKISLLVSALCALGACASFTACMTDSQNGKEENIEKARSNTNIVEQQGEEDNGEKNSECPDGECPNEKTEAPDFSNMPPMPEFRFMPHPEHMPSPANINKNADNENGYNENNENNNGEDGGNQNDVDDEKPENGKKPPKRAPHKGGKIKPKMPKKGE